MLLTDKFTATTVTEAIQSRRSAGDVQRVYENASAWPVIDNIKQSRGFGLLDGSTVDNSSGRYTKLRSALGNPGSSSSFDLPNEPPESNGTYTSYYVVSLVENVASNVLSISEQGKTFEALPGDVGERLTSSANANVSTSVSNNHVPVPGASISLSDGLWFVSYHSSVEIRNNTGADLDFYGKIQIFANGVGVGLTSASVGGRLGANKFLVDSVGAGRPVLIQGGPVVYDLRIGCSVGSANGTMTAFSASHDLSGNLAAPDTSTTISAIRYG